MNYEFFQMMMANGFETQQELANAAGVSQSYISGILNDGRTPSLVICTKIANAFAVHPIAPIELYKTLRSFAEKQNVII